MSFIQVFATIWCLLYYKYGESYIENIFQVNYEEFRAGMIAPQEKFLTSTLEEFENTYLESLEIKLFDKESEMRFEVLYRIGRWRKSERFFFLEKIASLQTFSSKWASYRCFRVRIALSINHHRHHLCTGTFNIFTCKPVSIIRFESTWPLYVSIHIHASYRNYYILIRYI